MKIVSQPEELVHFRHTLQGSVGFVPTMGALHNGHLSLIKRSIAENDHTVVSLFVNPTQFLPSEDLSTYPRRQEADLKLCKLAGVDAVFMPESGHMYSLVEPTLCAPETLGYALEGLRRPGHFDGVLRVVLKLFNLTQPTRAYFGKKDAQQLYLIQNMVRTFFLPITIVPCDIVREEDGLALSSRNAYLSPQEREDALKLSKALKHASRLVIQKEFHAKVLECTMLDTLAPLHVDYARVLRRDFTPLERVELGNTLIAIAAYVGSTRLIDNLWM
ncbi:MAG: pantoate--beta-alanine ligase [Campylobacterales bacterium]|nr:pantoate--beta-alanine ligase [Campylobacterales bacterium]